VDSFAGTTGNDTVNGYINTTTATVGNSTFTSADTISGGAGTDTLNYTVEGANAAGSIPAATISGIEVFNIRDLNTSGASTYNMSLVDGETSIISDRSTAAVIFTNVGTGASVTVRGNGSATNGATTFSGLSGTQAMTLNIDGGVTAGAITRNSTGAAALTINSTGAANTTGVIDLDTAALVAALTINATTGLNAALAADYAATAVVTVTGAGAVDLTGPTVAAGVVTTQGTTALDANILSVAATGSTGGVRVISGANTTSFTGGDGNDWVSVGALVYGGTGTLAGGAGTDTLVLQDAAQLTAITAAKMTGFEILRLNDDDDAGGDSFAATRLSGLTGLEIGASSAADGVTVTAMSAAVASNVTILGTQAVAPVFTLTNSTTPGQLDVLTIKVNDQLGGARNTITVADITAAGVETINLVTTDNLTLSAATGLTAMTALNVSGAGNVSITTGALALGVNTTVNASALTGTFTFVGTAGTTNPLSITGSATGVNTITGTANGDVIVGGSAADTITGGNGADTLTGGAGADIYVTPQAASTTTAAGVGIDSIVGFGANSDVLRFAAGDNVMAAGGAAVAATTVSVTAGGKATFAAADDTLTEMLVTLVADIAANDVVFFELGADTYVYGAGATADGTDDFMVKLTGVTGLTTITESTGTAGDFTIA
jgi:hypothetical protein